MYTSSAVTKLIMWTHCTLSIDSVQMGKDGQIMKNIDIVLNKRPQPSVREIICCYECDYRYECEQFKKKRIPCWFCADGERKEKGHETA